VKKLSDAFMDETKFHREVECLMRVKHKNVVRFLGYCADRQGNMERYNGKLVMADVHQRLLCFEYIPKGSLDKYIIGMTMWRVTFLIIFSFPSDTEIYIMCRITFNIPELRHWVS
jgi:serine/threonine protein kinase